MADIGKSLFTMTDAEKAEHCRLGAKIFERQGDAKSKADAEELARRFDAKAGR